MVRVALEDSFGVMSVGYQLRGPFVLPAAASDSGAGKPTIAVDQVMRSGDVST